MSEPRVLAERDGLYIIDKPEGVAVHPTNDPDIPDLVTWAREALGADLAPIHRLDRHTSGLVLMSPDPEVRARYGAMFADGQVSKTYHALVLGVPRPPQGLISKPLSDARRARPLEARTRYTVLEDFGRCAWLELEPLTGRKHQLRRHLHAIKHPIVGDARYRPKRLTRIHAFPHRMWLHALRLTLPDGTTFECPLPTELTEHLVALRALTASPP